MTARWFTLEVQQDDDGNDQYAYFHYMDEHESVIVVNFPLAPDDPLYQAFYTPLGALLDRIAADGTDLEVEG